MPMVDWSAARDEMILDPTIVNLNTGSFGPVPKPVFEKLTHWRRELAAEPTHFYLRTLPPVLWDARKKVAEYFGTSPTRFVFTLNVSVSINIIASGLKLPSPGEILLTDHEYGAMHWCWERAAQRQGLTLKTFPLPTMARDPGEIVEAAVKAMTPKTRLFFFSHILSPTGLILPAKELCAEARKRGIITVVDGAHAPAMIDLNFDDIRADFYTGNCHKWLLAASGSGFLTWSPGNEDRLQPLQVSWGYHPDPSKMDEPDEYGSTPRTRFLEFEGTKDPGPWITTPDAIDFQSRWGWSPIRERIRELSEYVRMRFAEKLPLPPATPPDRRLSGALTAFELPFRGPEKAKALRAAIWKHRIEIPTVERPDRLLTRVSTHFYNTEEEIDRLLEILPSAIREVQVG